MSGPLEQLLKGPPLELMLYLPGSRYYGLAIAEIKVVNGKTVRYLRRRFLPDPTALVTIAEHRVVDRDRLDNLAGRYMGDPLASWRIADANNVLRMEAIVEEIGRRVRITLPEGVQENPNG
jgi:hypothetical protein